MPRTDMLDSVVVRTSKGTSMCRLTYPALPCNQSVLNHIISYNATQSWHENSIIKAWAIAGGMIVCVKHSMP